MYRIFATYVCDSLKMEREQLIIITNLATTCESQKRKLKEIQNLNPPQINTGNVVNSAYQIKILWGNCNSSPMNTTKIGTFKNSYQPCFHGLL